MTLICHKRVASNEAAVLQACHVTDVHATMQPHRQCLSCQRRERLCAAERIIQPYLPLLLSQTPSLGSEASPPPALLTFSTHENCMHAEQIIIIFYILFFIFCSMYLVLFSIVLYRTIVTVYTDNIFLHNYLRQMHQIIHLSPVGCFTPARGKTVQKNREVSGVNPTYLSIFLHDCVPLVLLHSHCW